MAPVSGGEAKIILTKSTTWDTATAAGPGDLIALDSYGTSRDVDTIDQNNIGAGTGLRNNIEQGNVEDSIDISMSLGYENKGDVILASFYGNPQVPTEQNVGEGDYLHEVLFSPAAHNNGYLTSAELATDSDSLEMVTWAVNSISFEHDEPASPINLTVNGVGSRLECETPANTPAVINASTLGNTTKAIVQKSSFWLINPETDVALDRLNVAHKICPISASFELNRNLEITNTVCGVNASPVPRNTDFIDGSLTITLQNLEDLDYYLGAKNETSYKAQLIVEGAQIGAGDNKTYIFSFPRLKLENIPDRAVENAGDNNVTLTFTILAADVAPAGMSSNLPYYELTNERSTVY